jgi:hypothetical protein
MCTQVATACPAARPLNRPSPLNHPPGTASSHQLQRGLGAAQTHSRRVAAFLEQCAALGQRCRVVLNRTRACKERATAGMISNK